LIGSSGSRSHAAEQRLELGRLHLGVERLRWLEVDLVPWDEVGGRECLRLPLHVTIDVCESRNCDAVAGIRHTFTERLDRLERPPFAQFRAVDLREQLANGLAQCES
jgi:hypothetical protein